MRPSIVLGMAGSGGDGIVSAGELLMDAAASVGYHALMTKSFGSQIRGGESSCRVRLSNRRLTNPGGTLDLAIVLNWDDFLKFGAELPVGGGSVVVYDSRSNVAPDKLPLDGVTPAEAVSVPFADLAKKSAGTERAKNALVVGLLCEWLSISEEALLRSLRRKFSKKGEDALAAAERAFAAGIEHAREHPMQRVLSLSPPPDGGPKLLADGNEMCGAAALFAGCRFFGGYPITPSTEIMQFLSREIWKHGGAVLQAEDEIAGIGAAVGASFAGQKAMTATSGPGMSLKTEILGLATIAELPLVVVNVQRGGPSTGIPTKPEQADLFQACFSSHGDAVRPVLAPTSVADTFAMTVEAFNVAERYQTPVVLLSDQEIGQRKETVEPFDPMPLPVVERARPDASDGEPYTRYRQTESGISPIAHPGEPGRHYLAAGIEHNESGAPTASGAVHQRMNEKRIGKLDALKRRRDLFRIEGDPKAPLALVSWGSTAGVCSEALAMAASEGMQVKLLVPGLLFPVAEDVYRDFFRGVRGGLVVELSHQGQLHRILRMFVDVPQAVSSLSRSGANPFSPEEIVGALRSVTLGLQRQRSETLQPQE